MIIEEIFFTIIAFGLFVYIFLKMIQKNDTNYIGILVTLAIGIALNFISVIMKKTLSPFWIIIKYITILIPIAILILEKRGIQLIEIISIAKAQIYFKLGNNKKAKEGGQKCQTKI